MGPLLTAPGNRVWSNSSRISTARPVSGCLACGHMQHSTGVARAPRPPSEAPRFPAAPPADPADSAGGAGGPEGVAVGLTVRVRYDAIPLVFVAGELDVATAPLLSAVLEHVRRAASCPVEVDLRGVSFADSHDLAPVLDTGAAVREVSAPVRRVLAALAPLATPGRPRRVAAADWNGRR